jgi:hypothetical protein
MNTEFAGGERGDNEALSAQTKALLDIDPTALFLSFRKIAYSF